MLRKIVLHGRLGKRFGRSFMLDVASPAEALRALVLQLRGFRMRLRASST
jgi:predicted phage tail protein